MLFPLEQVLAAGVERCRRAVTFLLVAAVIGSALRVARTGVLSLMFEQQRERALFLRYVSLRARPRGLPSVSDANARSFAQQVRGGGRDSQPTRSFCLFAHPNTFGLPDFLTILSSSAKFRQLWHSFQRLLGLGL